jgi:hypothetical protein
MFTCMILHRKGRWTFSPQVIYDQIEFPSSKDIDIRPVEQDHKILEYMAVFN